MRYTRVAKGAYGIGLVLVTVAVSFAAVRSRPGTHEAPRPASQQAAPTPQDGRALGAQVFEAECESCHPAGEARKGTPALRGRAVELFESAGGREYLVHFLLTGEMRTVVDGKPVLEVMHSSYDQLTDDEASAVLNHMLTAWGNEARLPKGPKLYTPAEIAAARGELER